VRASQNGTSKTKLPESSIKSSKVFILIPYLKVHSTFPCIWFTHIISIAVLLSSFNQDLSTLSEQPDGLPKAQSTYFLREGLSIQVKQ
jgi:hypothetical protein